MRKSGRRLEAIERENKASSTAASYGPISPEQDAAADTNVVNGTAISLPKPIYPAKARGQTGTIIVRVIIDESGNVTRACAISGPAVLMQETERAAFHAKFTTTLLEGRLVKVQGIITYNFVRQ